MTIYLAFAHHIKYDTARKERKRQRQTETQKWYIGISLNFASNFQCDEEEQEVET